MFIVYMLTNQISGKSYLGYSSKTVEDRFTTHIRYAESGGTTHLAKAIRKYPIDSWKLETLIQNIETKPEALAKEIELIAFYNTFPFGYNLTSGGERGYHTIKSKESCLKISKALKGRKLSQATKEDRKSVV